ncbi:MAG: multidrug ABC transporter permease, partial [Nitrososphaerota archaeon]
VSYLTDAIRQLTIFPLNSSTLVIDFVYLGVFAIILSAIGITLSWRYLTR